MDSLFDALASTERRCVLRVARESDSERLDLVDLATDVAAGVHDKPTAAVTPRERKQTHVSLYHQHLPVLDAAGLVDYDPQEGAVAVTDHAAFRDPGVVDAIEQTTTAGPDELDALFDALSVGRRRLILDVLSHQFGRIHVETLASELCAVEQDTTESAVADSAVARTSVSLRHNHLPALAAASLIEYDADAATVEYAGHPDLSVPWMHSVLAPDFRATLTGETDPTGVGSIEGREQVVSFGQSLCDRASDELFCLFTESNLLEAGCLARIRDAANRGTDVYLGVRDPTIREYVREHAPEVTLWEPETNWLNLPVEQDRVGRLVLADREAVMIGTLGTQTADDAAVEQALVGEGQHNPLALMVRQLVRPRLDQPDGDGDVETELQL